MSFSNSAGKKSAFWAIPVALLMSLLVIVVPALRNSQASAADGAPTLALGTLGTSPLPVQMATETGLGLKTAMMEVSWRSWETAPGVFNATYENQMAYRLRMLRSAGFDVTLGLGLHYAPSWALSQPNGVLVDQYGVKSSQVNLIFNNSLRQQANAYLDRVNQILGFSNFAAIRVTSGGRSELLYPDGGHYWAFDADAQNGADLPATVGTNPLQGWVPGTAGHTVAEVTDWSNWYLNALVDVARWQINDIRADGFTGDIQVVTPGVGVYARKIGTFTNNNMPNGMFGVGAVWSKIYAGLAGTPNLVAYVSSVSDGSAGNDQCTPSDDTQPIDGPATVWWSSTRWISRVADEYGIKKAGENPGYSPTARNAAFYTDQSSAGMMNVAVGQARSCGFGQLYWAHDDQFWTNISSLTKWASLQTS